MEGDDKDVRGLLDRVAKSSEEASSSSSSWWGGWGGWQRTLDAVTAEVQSASSSVVAKLETVMAEATVAGADVLSKVSNSLEEAGKQALTLASDLERQLGLADAEHEGFERYYVQNGGPLLTADLKELRSRCAVAVEAMQLDEPVFVSAKATAQNLRRVEEEEAADDADVAKRVTDAGIDVSAVEDCAKQHAIVLVEAHTKLLNDLKSFSDLPKEEKEEKIAQTSVQSKVRMQELYSLGQMELLKRAILLISNEADKVVGCCPEVSNAVETGVAEYSGAIGAPEQAQVSARLRALHSYLNMKFRKFQKNYSGLVGNLDQVVASFCENEELLSALKQLVKVTEGEIVVDSEAALLIVEEIFGLLDGAIILMLCVRRQQQQQEAQQQEAQQTQEQKKAE